MGVRALWGRTVDVALIGLVALLAIRLLLSDARASTQRGESVTSEPTAAWTRIQAAAVAGDTSAEVQVVAFVDYQCEACRQVHWVLDSLRLEHRGRISVGVIPFPLRRHPHAVAAANAAQCASEQGRFREFEDAAYRAQQSIGRLPLDSLAGRAEVADLPAFRNCIAAADTLPAVKQGLELAYMLALPGTPSLVVNGNLLTRIPDADALVRYLTAMLRTKPPR